MNKYFYKVDQRAGRSVGVYDAPPSFGQCKYCGDSMVRLTKTTQRAGEPYTDDVCLCATCGWWEYMMREPWIATEYHGALLDFAHRDDTIRSVTGLLEELALGERRPLEVSPRQFEEIAYAYFRNTVAGSVALTVPSNDGGFDLYCVDSGSGPFIVEVKRYAGKIGVLIVRNLLGVMVVENVARGIIFHASELTRGAKRLVTQVNAKGAWRLESKSVNDIMAWLHLTWEHYDPEYLWSHIKGLSFDADTFAIPQEFFVHPERYA